MSTPVPIELNTATDEQLNDILESIGAVSIRDSSIADLSVIGFTDHTVMVEGDIVDFAFDGSGATVALFGSGCTAIGGRAFNGCALTSLVIPASVTYLGGGETFRNNNSLAEVRILGPVTHIPGYCFANGLFTVIYFPATVMELGGYALAGAGTTHWYFEGNAPTADNSTFAYSVNGTIYYKPGTTGWTNPFYERTTAEWTSYPEPMP